MIRVMFAFILHLGLKEQKFFKGPEKRFGMLNTIIGSDNCFC